MFRSKYIVVIDLDDIIVPHAFKSLPEMTKGIGQVDTPAAYITLGMLIF